MKLKLAEGLSLPLDEILSQHIAVLGKTGSGKTSTAKFLIEHVVAEGARVCVLDPIKSDWWGLTSSTDGKRAGLPFHILGGPRGHVPLHASAGKVIGEIVANGSLPMSIIDMADFEPGGQAKFFTEFAPTLLRKMRGVVYLVIEEAHLFAPKERSGIGAENLSIHWAKTLATAGRSKGVRLVLVTQRTQALHNALLGSCDTMIAHRLTAPADQEPVIKWLKANTSKDVLEKVTSSLASLKTGDAWLCSGEAKRFEVVHFPRITTYDNTATPTGDGDTREIKTAAVDQEKLRAIIGDAAEKAKADDPRELRKKIAEQKRQLEILQASQNSTDRSKNTRDIPVLTDADRALLEKVGTALSARAAQAKETISVADRQLETAVQRAAAEYLNLVRKVGMDAALNIEQVLERIGFLKVLDKLATVKPAANYSETIHRPPAVTRAVSPDRSSAATRPTEPRAPRVPDGSGLAGDPQPLPPGELATLTAALQYPGLDKKRLGVLTGYKRSSRDAYVARLVAKGLIDVRGAALWPTIAGGAQLNGSFEPLPTGAALVEYWRQRLPEGERRTLEVVLRTPRGHETPRSDIDEATGYKRSSRDAYLTRLKARGLVDFPGPGVVLASEELFG